MVLSKFENGRYAVTLEFHEGYGRHGLRLTYADGAVYFRRADNAAHALDLFRVATVLGSLPGGACIAEALP